MGRIRNGFANLSAFFGAAPEVARQVLRHVLKGQPIVVTPLSDGVFHFSGSASFQQILAGEEVLGARPTPRLTDVLVVGTEEELAGMPGVTTVEASTVERPLSGQVLNKRWSVPSVWCPRGDASASHGLTIPLLGRVRPRGSVDDATTSSCWSHGSRRCA